MSRKNGNQRHAKQLITVCRTVPAIALIDGVISDKQFAPERFAHPEIWKFLENVKVARHGELSGMYPGAVANIVHVDLVDGKRLTKRVDYPIGHAKNPLKDSEVEEKFFALVRGDWSKDARRRLSIWRGSWTQPPILTN